MKKYLLQVLIAIDQLLNTLFCGYADETLSSRSWRRYNNGSSLLDKLPCMVIDKLFFWDYTITGDRVIRHCEQAYISEIKRLQYPPEFRNEND